MSHRRPSSLQPANDPYERGSYYAPSRNNIRSYASVRPWGSKVQQRRDCIGSAKEQTSTDTLYLHGFMSNQLVRKLFAPSNPFSSIPWNSTHGFANYSRLRSCVYEPRHCKRVYTYYTLYISKRKLRCSRDMDTLLLFHCSNLIKLFTSRHSRRLHYAKSVALHKQSKYFFSHLSKKTFRKMT